jgi:hypothetical protein
MTDKRKQYQREWARKRRQGAKSVDKAVDKGVTASTSVDTGYDNKIYPNRAAWEVAVVRAERARKYALACPEHVRPSEMKFQTVDWQYYNEGLPATRRKEA